MPKSAKELGKSAQKEGWVNFKLPDADAQRRWAIVNKGSFYIFENNEGTEAVHFYTLNGAKCQLVSGSSCGCDDPLAICVKMKDSEVFLAYKEASERKAWVDAIEAKPQAPEKKKRKEPSKTGKDEDDFAAVLPSPTTLTHLTKSRAAGPVNARRRPPTREHLKKNASSTFEDLVPEVKDDDAVVARKAKRLSLPSESMSFNFAVSRQKILMPKPADGPSAAARTKPGSRPDHAILPPALQNPTTTASTKKKPPPVAAKRPSVKRKEAAAGKSSEATPSAEQKPPGRLAEGSKPAPVPEEERVQPTSKEVDRPPRKMEPVVSKESSKDDASVSSSAHNTTIGQCLEQAKELLRQAAEMKLQVERELDMAKSQRSEAEQAKRQALELLRLAKQVVDRTS